MALSARANGAAPARRRLATVGAVVCVLAAIVAWVVVGFPPHTLVDIDQGRLDAATPPLDGAGTISQTFLSRHANLAEIEFWAVVYDAEQPLPEGARLRLTLERLGAGGQDGAPAREVWVDVDGVRHNDRLRVAFAPLEDSAGARYRATLWAPEPYGLGFWRTDGDALAPGDLLIDGAPAAGDLALTTYYRYTPAAAAGDLAAGLASLASRAGALLPGLLLLLPGWALALWLPVDPRWDLWTRLALVLALSLSFWALLTLWAGTLGVSAGGARAWVPLGAAGIAAASALAGGRRVFRAGTRAGGAWPAHLAMVVVLALSVAGRTLNVRDLVVPNWVDSLHHTLIARLISEAGGVPATYLPYLPVEDLHYHFGFHAAAAGLTWLAPLRADQAVLLLGQALSALAPLAAYALAGWLFRRRWAGVGAALVAAALSYMPAYYASWGRYTQLAGLVMLPLACLVAARALRRDGARHLPAAALLAAGLALVHYRVLLLYLAAWPLLAVGQALAEERRWRALGRVVGRGLAAGGLAIALIGPWTWRFAAQVFPRVASTYGGWAAQGDGGGNVLSVGLLGAYWMRPLLITAGAGLLWGLVRRRGTALLLGLWVGAWFLAANLHVLGLSDIWLLDNDAVSISLWLPAGALCGYLVADATALAAAWLRARWTGLPWGFWREAALLTAVVVLGVLGTWTHVDIVNPVTILVAEEDVRAMAWVREHTPRGALFLVNSRGWQGDIRMGSDAGWWLPMLADRRATMPAVLYHHGTTAYREAVGDLSLEVEEADSPDDPALLSRLAAEGVTHVYVGAKGGHLLPRDLDPSPHYRAIYSDGPVRVYELAP